VLTSSSTASLSATRLTRWSRDTSMTDACLRRQRAVGRVPAHEYRP
jgi:hypothetical protein